jgi:hypothetical protein
MKRPNNFTRADDVPAVVGCRSAQLPEPTQEAACDCGVGYVPTAEYVSRITHFEGQVIALFDGVPAGTSRAL